MKFLLILALAASSLVATSAFAQASEPLRFSSCAALRSYLAARQPREQVRLAPQTYACSEPPVLSVDGLTVDFGGSLIRVADNALRPGVVVGDLHTPPEQRHRAITVRNLKVEGNREHQQFECWDGPCNPAANPNPLWQQRLNGITVNGCDDCALIDVEVHGARSGGVVVVSSNRLLIDGMAASGSYFDGLAAYHTRGQPVPQPAGPRQRLCRAVVRLRFLRQPDRRLFVERQSRPRRVHPACRGQSLRARHRKRQCAGRRLLRSRASERPAHLRCRHPSGGCHHYRLRPLWRLARLRVRGQPVRGVQAGGQRARDVSAVARPI